MQHHLPAPFKERHSQLWNVKNLEATLIFFFFFLMGNIAMLIDFFNQ